MMQTENYQQCQLLWSLIMPKLSFQWKFLKITLDTDCPDGRPKMLTFQLLVREIGSITQVASNVVLLQLCIYGVPWHNPRRWDPQTLCARIVLKEWNKNMIFNPKMSPNFKQQSKSRCL